MWRDVAADQAVRVAVVTGAGRAFSAGGDLEMVAGMSGDYARVARWPGEARSLVDQHARLREADRLGHQRHRRRRRTGRRADGRHQRDRRGRPPDRRTPAPRRRRRRPRRDPVAAAVRDGQGQVLPADRRFPRRARGRAHRPRLALRPGEQVLEEALAIAERLAAGPQQARPLDQAHAQPLAARRAFRRSMRASPTRCSASSAPTSPRALRRSSSAARPASRAEAPAAPRHRSRAPALDARSRALSDWARTLDGFAVLARQAGVAIELDEAAYLAILLTAEAFVHEYARRGQLDLVVEKEPAVQSLARILFQPRPVTAELGGRACGPRAGGATRSSSAPVRAAAAAAPPARRARASPTRTARHRSGRGAHGLARCRGASAAPPAAGSPPAFASAASCSSSTACMSSSAVSSPKV